MRHTILRALALAATLLPLAIAPAAAAQEPEPTRYALAGTIGDLPVRMQLSVGPESTDGSYVYETTKAARHSVVDAISLSGTVDKSGRAELSESTSDAAGNELKTGTIHGTLTTGESGAKLVGTWTKADGSRQLPVALAERTATDTGIRIVTKKYRVANAKFAKIVSVSYPSFVGTDASVKALDAEIERWVATMVREYEEAVDDETLSERAETLSLDVDYEVTLANADLVSVLFTIYEDFGGAHPSSEAHAVNFDMHRGRPLALADLFADKRGYLRALSARARPLFTGEPDLSADTSPRLENYGIWYLTPNGLSIVFPVAHVVGDTAEAYIPFRDLKGLVNPNGPAGRFVK
jgi:hypothetical protein